MAKLITTVTTVKEEYEVTRGDIIGLMRDRGIAVPNDAEIFVPVPGGCDWSNTNLDIESDAPLKVRFSYTE